MRLKMAADNRAEPRLPTSSPRTPPQALMVGDRLYTDIACGANAGVDTALVLTGEATAADAAASNTPPTAVYPDCAALLEALRRATGVE